jgi:D-alanine-D-alanine ligase
MPIIKVALLFGGESAEHNVSIISARNIYAALDRKRYQVVPVGITKGGRWFLQENEIDFPLVISETGPQVMFVPGGRGQIVLQSKTPRLIALEEVDVVFPVLHGPRGEDGTVQGLLSLAGVPFVGSNVLASAAAMDKDATKRLLRDAGLPVPRFFSFFSRQRPSFSEAQQAVGSSVVFVKPARLGSSIGIRKASSDVEFNEAVEIASHYDSKILVEEFVDGVELECAVLEDPKEEAKVIASIPGEIVPAASRHEFYSYQAKYVDEDGALLRIPAAIEQSTIEKIQNFSTRAFHILGCEGMARVDFFLKRNGDLLINEVNTIPGFTNISMFPKMLSASEINYQTVVDILIQHAFARAEREQLVRGFTPE